MIEQILSNFKIYGDFMSAIPFGKGHINDTFLVSFNQAGIKTEYILRKINKFVFKNPEIVISNTENVINHITKKLKESGIKEITNHVMQLIETKDSKYYHIDEKNDYWCLMFVIKNAYTVEYTDSNEKAYQAAKAFGRFQKYLIDVNLHDYKDTIPNFHNLQNRINSFEISLEKNPVGRVNYVRKEIEIINSYRFLSEKITMLLKNKKLPIRLTHNDTKINNVMLNKETHEGQCVIDLDTLMHGTVLYDFGDMVRTSTSPVEEDEKDATKVFMDISTFEALVKGYLEELADVLLEIEISNLVYGAMIIVYEQAVRFLTDYILNDVYYNIEYPEHNLVRTRTQIALLESIKIQKDSMESIVKKYSIYPLYHS
ncbi:MAG: aminoglycoside phosphotransferase family protein [Ignavibacteriae bacterium]|nr:aminoglycoside phosphotransferase family protein [Ignavibacteriota bacterium]